MRALRLVWLACALACGVADGSPPFIVTSTEIAEPPSADPTQLDSAPVLYPDARAIFRGEQGIYRSCAANRGVCHNAKEYPDFATSGALASAIHAPCNVNRSPERVHDLCEVPGDVVALGSQRVELGSIRLLDAPREDDGLSQPRLRLRLRAPVHPRRGPVRIERWTGRVHTRIASVVYDGVRGRRRADIIARMPDYDERAYTDNERLRGVLHGSWPGAIRFGDPNGNGVYGARLRGALVVPGEPERSYLWRRLTDATAGPLMPRANCCQFSKATLRALFCWISGLESDGSNADEPIEYAGCPSSPAGNLVYPDPGPGCETAGMCPVSERASEGAEPTWAGVYGILAARCGDPACHGGNPDTSLDVSTPEAARATLDSLVASGYPAASEIFRRVSPELCHSNVCELMPLGGEPLPAGTREVLREWIVRGAEIPVGSAGAP
jgi:hypothetical protein